MLGVKTSRLVRCGPGPTRLQRSQAFLLQGVEFGPNGFGNFRLEPDAQLIEQVQDPAELHGGLAVLDVSNEDVAHARAACEVVGPKTRRPACRSNQ